MPTLPQKWLATVGRRMRLRTKIAAVILLGLMALATWDCVQGRSPEDAMRRTQSAFIARAAFEGCEDPVARTVPVNRRHTTHYGAQLPTERIIRARWEREIQRRYGGTFFDRIEVQSAGDMEIVSFPNGGVGCYDNVFVPVVVVVEFGWGSTLSFPATLRVTQAKFGFLFVPFLGPEILGLYHDESIAPRKCRGRVDETGWVPPAPSS